MRTIDLFRPRLFPEYLLLSLLVFYVAPMVFGANIFRNGGTLGTARFSHTATTLADGRTW